MAGEGWKLLVIGAILGGFAGLGISRTLNPQYETFVVYSFGFDYARTGLMTDIEEDQAMETAGDIINSTDVRNTVAERAGELGIKLSDEEIRTGFSAERRFGQWLLKVRRADSKEAALLANMWGEAARTALQNAREAAWQADALHRYILSLESCFQQSTSGLAAQPLCQASDRLKLQEEIQSSGTDLSLWQDTAQGYFPGLDFSWAQEAEESKTPIQFSVGILTLGGCLAGILVSLLTLIFLKKF